jgi:anti-sigma regulatory factor (Ser/Thr protein kinase)
MVKSRGQPPTGERTIEAVAMTGIDRGSTGSQSESGARVRHHDGSRAACLDTVYPPQGASAAQMRRALRDYLAAQALDAAVVCDVVLAADEAFINAVGHAEAADHPIRVTACVSESEASVEIRDGGGRFTLSRSEVPPVPDVRRVRGRGVFLMKSLMDEVSVRSGRRGTTVRMVRHLA